MESTLQGAAMRLVLRRERRRGDLRDHESGIEAAVLHQERRQAAHLGVDQHGHAALRQVADLGERERERIGGERHGLGVEISARQHVALFDEQQGIVGHRVGLGAKRARRNAG